MQIAGVGAWRQIGLSLVELMISLALGSVILLVVFRVYFQVIENSRFDTEFTTIRHKSRMLFDVLSMYIQSSGAYGCKDTKLGLVIHQDSTKTAFNFETPIEGAEYASDVWVPALSVIPAEANTKSDVLVVRGPVDDFSFLTVGMSDATSAIAVGVGKPYKKEDVLVISDCMGTTRMVFRPFGLK
ncbi:MAG: prepilin-type N-terminal cleavage/methylation domain-containing protein [Gammaproteobacteria bacterium]